MTSRSPAAYLKGDSVPRKRIGDAAEEVVRDFLVAAGCEILYRNLRVGRFELDIVARDQSLALIVEVRYRGNGAWTSALGSVTTQKRLRTRRAGERLWNQVLKHDVRIERMRFDVAGVTFSKDSRASVEYVAGAF